MNCKNGKDEENEIQIKMATDMAINEFGHGLLHKAVIHDRRKDFVDLLQAGKNINQKDELGFTPLHLAALLGRNSIIKELLKWLKEKEPLLDANAISAKGQTALHLSAQNGSATTLLLLLKIGCNQNIVDRCGKTALDVANKFLNFDCVRILEHGSDKFGDIFEEYEIDKKVTEKGRLSIISAQIKKRRSYSANKNGEDHDSDHENVIRTFSLPFGLDSISCQAAELNRDQEGLGTSCLQEDHLNSNPLSAEEFDITEPEKQYLCSALENYTELDSKAKCMEDELSDDLKLHEDYPQTEKQPNSKQCQQNIKEIRNGNSLCYKHEIEKYAFRPKNSAFWSDSQISRKLSNVAKFSATRRNCLYSNASELMLYNINCYTQPRIDGWIKRAGKNSNRKKSMSSLRNIWKKNVYEEQAEENEIENDPSNGGKNLATNWGGNCRFESSTPIGHKEKDFVSEEALGCKKSELRNSKSISKTPSEPVLAEYEQKGSNSNLSPFQQYERFVEVPIKLLCSDCRQKHKFESIARKGIQRHLNSHSKMGASESIQGLSDLWEKWELEQKGQEEGVSRPSSKQLIQQNELFGFKRSLSLPDLTNTKLKSQILDCGYEEDIRSTSCFDVNSPADLSPVFQKHSQNKNYSIDNPVIKISHFSDSKLVNRIGKKGRESLGNGSPRNKKEVSVQSFPGLGKTSFNHIGGMSEIERTFQNSLSSSISIPMQCSSVTCSEGWQISQSNSFYSPVLHKPNLPVIFCENIYRSLSDSDIPALLGNKIHSSFYKSKAFSLSTSALDVYAKEDDLRYFPFGDSISSPSQFHECYDWSLCADPEYQPPDKNHLTVSMKSRNDNEEAPMAYTYICSEEEDLERSFVCSDCGSAIAQLSVNHSDSIQEAADEFVLICYPNEDIITEQSAANEHDFEHERETTHSNNNEVYFNNEIKINSISSKDYTVSASNAISVVTLKHSGQQKADISSNEVFEESQLQQDVLCLNIEEDLEGDKTLFNHETCTPLSNEYNRDQDSYQFQNPLKITVEDIEVREAILIKSDQSKPEYTAENFEFECLKGSYCSFGNDLFQKQHLTSSVMDIPRGSQTTEIVHYMEGECVVQDTCNINFEEQENNRTGVVQSSGYIADKEPKSAVKGETLAGGDEILPLENLPPNFDDGVSKYMYQYHNDNKDSINGEKLNISSCNNDEFLAESNSILSENQDLESALKSSMPSAASSNVVVALQEVLTAHDSSNAEQINDNLDLISNDTGIDMDELSVTDFEEINLDVSLFTNESKDKQEDEHLTDIGSTDLCFSSLSISNVEPISASATCKEESKYQNNLLEETTALDFPSGNSLAFADNFISQSKDNTSKSLNNDIRGGKISCEDSFAILRSPKEKDDNSLEWNNCYSVGPKSSFHGSEFDHGNNYSENDNNNNNSDVGTISDSKQHLVESKKKDGEKMHSKPSNVLEKLSQFINHPSESIEFECTEKDKKTVIIIYFFNFMKEQHKHPSVVSDEEAMILQAVLEVEMVNQKCAKKCSKKNSALKIASCLLSLGNHKSSNLKSFWFLTDPKIFALLIVRIAESRELADCKFQLANYLCEKVIRKTLCSFNLVINWWLIFFGLIKNEFNCNEIVDFDKASAILLLRELLTTPYFKLAYVRQLAFFFASPNHVLIPYRDSRIAFLETCFNLELKDSPFSSRYPFKIFSKVQLLFSNIDKDLKSAYEILDGHLTDYLHQNNCIDFVTDVLMYMGLLKSEFSLDITSDIRICLLLLDHIAAEEYFPKSGAPLLQAFIAKPNNQLEACGNERQHLLNTLDNAIKKLDSI